MSRERGFTLVELLLAAAVFSVALVAITAGLIQLFRGYQSGISIRKTQNSAREISEELTRAARDANSIVGTANSVCFYYPKSREVNAVDDGTRTGVRYFVQSQQLFKAQRDEVVMPAGVAPPCDDATFASATPNRVSDDEVLLLVFNAQASTIRSLDLDMRLVTESGIGDVDMVTDPLNPRCNPGFEYCSMTTIRKTVMARADND